MSWWQLHSILREQAELERYYRQAEPLACPNDGQPLTPGPPNRGDVVKFCHFCGWEYPRDHDPVVHSGM